jgi:hypothetical protein
MKPLFIETDNGNVPIENKVKEKYNLEKGTTSPFTGERILGKSGDFTKEIHEEPKTLDNIVKEEGVVENEDGVMLTQSEIIDLSHGEDSYQ